MAPNIAPGTEAYFTFGTHMVEDIDLLGQYSIRLKEMLAHSQSRLYIFLESTNRTSKSIEEFYQSISHGMSYLNAFDLTRPQQTGVIETLKNFYKKVTPTYKFDRNPFIEAQLSLVDQLNNLYPAEPDGYPRVRLIIENADTHSLETIGENCRTRLDTSLSAGDLGEALSTFVQYIHNEAEIIDRREEFVRTTMRDIKASDPEAIFAGMYGIFHSLMFEGMQDISCATEVLDHGERPWAIDHFNLTDQIQRHILLSKHAEIDQPTELDYMRGLISYKLQKRQKDGTYKNFNRFNLLSCKLATKAIASEKDFHELYERIILTPKQGFLGEVTQIIYDFLKEKDRLTFNELIHMR